MIFVFCFLSIFIFAETTTSVPATSTVDAKKQEMANVISKLADDFDKNNRDLSCKKISDCEALAMGHRKCGGPDYYLVISKKNKKAPLLRQLSSQHQKLREEYLKIHQKGMMGICSVAVAPEIACINKKCMGRAAQ
jgi:hypothetical protein